MNSALKEMRYAFRFLAPFRAYRKVSIFGSARIPSEAPEYKLAERLAEEIVRAGCS